jgi:glycosyltransferase involved in cell wall biosynthesis
MATGKGIGTFGSEFIDIGIKVIHKPLLKRIDLPFRFFPYFIDFYKLLKSENVDVVHIHRMYLYFWFAFIAKLAGTKTVVRTIHNVFKPKLRYPQYYLSRKVLKVLNVKFTSIGHSVEKHELNYFGNSTIRINNWFDANKFYPLNETESKNEIRSNLKIPVDSFVVISIGSCLHQKNHDHIIRVANKLREKYPKIFYLHLGTGPLCAREIKLVNSLGLDKHVLYAGNVTNVRDYIVASDLYIMPSDFEGLGNALLEAMACGIPCIGYNVSGIRDLITDKVNGYIIPNSEDSLSETIVHIVGHIDEGRLLALKARTFVESEYSIIQGVEKFMEVYLNR